MFAYSYEARYGDYESFDTVKPEVILDIIQDISIKNSAACGYGLEKLNEINRAWMLMGTSVHFEKPVSTKHIIEVSTAVKRFRGVTSERGCIISQDGQIVAKTISNWFLVDTEKMKPCRVPEEMISAYKCHDFKDDFFEYKKPRLCDFEKADYTVKISRGDIDTNNHLNNQKGAGILINALPCDFKFSDIKLLYKKASYYGDIRQICIKETEGGYLVQMQTEEKELCIAGEFLRI